MVMSHEAKKQHVCTTSDLRDHYSELFTRMATLKFENAITHSHYSSITYLITDLARTD